MSRMLTGGTLPSVIGIPIARKICVYWVEIHTANDKEIKVVLDKLRWLRAWLKGDGVLLSRFERDFVWVSSGATSFTLSSPQLKQFAQLGLQHKGSVLRIPSSHTPLPL